MHNLNRVFWCLLFASGLSVSQDGSVQMPLVLLDQVMTLGKKPESHGSYRHLYTQRVNLNFNSHNSSAMDEPWVVLAQRDATLQLTRHCIFLVTQICSRHPLHVCGTQLAHS